jgi:hypothetical protein
MAATHDITGFRFGRLTAASRVGTDRHGNALWACRCDCGNSTVCVAHALRCGKTKSCGCLRKETIGAVNRKHGHATQLKGRTPTYRIWRSMINRCTYEGEDSYKYYGGRGIAVCDRWLHSYDNFLADMGERPKGKTLDRIDNDLGYGPLNCRWATPTEQGRNTSTNRLITWDGKTLCLSEWAELTGFRSGTIANRLNLGWPVERALTAPIRVSARVY